MSTTLTFKIHGMDCAEEVALLKKAVGPKVGGEDRLAFETAIVERNGGTH